MGVWYHDGSDLAAVYYLGWNHSVEFCWWDRGPNNGWPRFAVAAYGPPQWSMMVEGRDRQRKRWLLWSSDGVTSPR